MEPFFFETGDEELFGVYHPANDVFSRKAILVCPPAYSEYFRTYRFLRKVADAWAGSGFHVMRFDYFGTGDSMGKWSDGGPERWARDTKAAVQELLEVSGAESVTLFGIRLGAAFALQAAGTTKVASRIVLWDPVLNGKEYVKSLERSHERLLLGSDVRVRDKLRRLDSELAGFPRERWIDNDLAALDLTSSISPTSKEFLCIVSKGETLNHQFAESVRSAGKSLRVETMDDDCDWSTPSESALQAPGIQSWLKSCL